jgi:hypothetical protein
MYTLCTTVSQNQPCFLRTTSQSLYFCLCHSDPSPRPTKTAQKKQILTSKNIKKKKKKGKKKATRLKKQRQGKASLPPLNPDSEPEQLVALSRFPIRTAWERDRGEKASNKREGKEPRVTHAPRKANNARAHHIFLVINILDKK